MEGSLPLLEILTNCHYRLELKKLHQQDAALFSQVYLILIFYHQDFFAISLIYPLCPPIRKVLPIMNLDSNIYPLRCPWDALSIDIG